MMAHISNQIFFVKYFFFSLILSKLRAVSVMLNL